MKNIFVTILNLQFLDFSIDLLYIQWKYILTSDSPHLHTRDWPASVYVFQWARDGFNCKRGQLHMVIVGKLHLTSAAYETPFCPPNTDVGKNLNQRNEKSNLRDRKWRATFNNAGTASSVSEKKAHHLKGLKCLYGHHFLWRQWSYDV